ncbi:MAG: tetratricopeptide repeat protein [Bacteroidota bacterium]
MLEKRKRITKKEIKKDKLVTTYYKAQSFFLENQARILIGAAVVVLIVVAVILFINKRSNDNKTAAGLLAKVIPLYETGSYKDAIEGQKAGNIVGLKKIVDDYGSTENGEAAKIFLANAYSLTGNTDAALKTYDDYSGSNPLFKATALAGKAGCLEVKKEYEKAAALYKDAAKVSKTNPANGEYLLRAGINLIKLGRKAEAKTVFEAIKKDYKNSQAFYELDRYLIQVES